MIDPELKSHLETIERELVDLKEKSTDLKHTFLRGMVYGGGYVIGAVLVITFVGWILNIVGVIPALATQVNEFRAALEHINSPIK
jgi:hypothetical protein